MRHAETVTFGGSALDRAGEIRGNPEALAQLRADPAARAIVFWRGKPLIAPERPAGLVRLAMDHPALQEAAAAPILLGREDGAARFAVDISGWQPADLDQSQLGAFLDPSEQRHPLLGDDMAFAELRRVMTWLDPRDAELAASGIARAAALRPIRPKADGSASAPTAAARISRAPTRWSSC
jgi:NAD+ diphosphatase